MTVSRTYPETPLLSVSVLCRKGDQVLLVKRLREPFKDHWSLPGGLVEVGETLLEAAARELEEETAVRAQMHDIAEVFDSIQRDDDGRVKSHYVLSVVLATYESGTMIAQDDAAEAEWCAPEVAFERLVTPGTAERIQRLLPRFPADSGS